MGGVFRADFAVWTSYNLLCYGRIPLRFQPTTTALMSAAWSAYISCVATGPAPTRKREELILELRHL